MNATPMRQRGLWAGDIPESCKAGETAMTDDPVQTGLFPDPHDGPIRERLWELIHEMRFAMVIGHAPGGNLRSRPLTTQNKRGDLGDELVFFVPADGEAARDATTNTTMLVVYADPRRDAYVSVAGASRVVRDVPRQQALWSTMADAWFPGGADDPNLRLLCVHIENAEYWDVTSSKPMQLLKMAQAAITGQPPLDLTEHGRLKA